MDKALARCATSDAAAWRPPRPQRVGGEVAWSSVARSRRRPLSHTIACAATAQSKEYTNAVRDSDGRRLAPRSAAGGRRGRASTPSPLARCPPTFIEHYVIAAAGGGQGAWEGRCRQAADVPRRHRHQMTHVAGTAPARAAVSSASRIPAGEYIVDVAAGHPHLGHGMESEPTDGAPPQDRLREGAAAKRHESTTRCKRPRSIASTPVKTAAFRHRRAARIGTFKRARSPSRTTNAEFAPAGAGSPGRVNRSGRGRSTTRG